MYSLFTTKTNCCGIGQYLNKNGDLITINPQDGQNSFLSKQVSLEKFNPGPSICNVSPHPQINTSNDETN